MAIEVVLSIAKLCQDKALCHAGRGSTSIKSLIHYVFLPRTEGIKVSRPPIPADTVYAEVANEMIEDHTMLHGPCRL